MRQGLKFDGVAVAGIGMVRFGMLRDYPMMHMARDAGLLAHCEGRLARYKLPRSLDFVDVMPRDPNGKLYKRTLRDPYWVGRERAI